MLPGDPCQLEQQPERLVPAIRLEHFVQHLPGLFEAPAVSKHEGQPRPGRAQVRVRLTQQLLERVDRGPRAVLEAKALNERALLILEKALGPMHPDVAICLSNLANVHRVTGAYDAAKALHERALSIAKTVLGPEHPSVASSLVDLANIHSLTGAHDEAKALYEGALAIFNCAKLKYTFRWTHRGIR